MGRAVRFEGRGDVSGVDGEEVRILGGPFCGEAVEGALGVVLLVGSHVSDSNDQVVETFGGRPKIADADHSVAKIGMADRSQHTALWSAARIAEEQVDFEHVNVAFATACGLR
jgi:hypothetical protein